MPRHPLIALFLLLTLGFLPAVHAERPSDTAAPALHFGVLSVAPPARAVAKWTPFAHYLEQRLGRSVEVIAPRGFERLTRAIEEGKLDVFYINSHVYYRLKRKGLAKPLAQMVNLNGSTFSRSLFFVRKDAPIDELHQIEGHRMAYISPLGAGAYLAPRARLHEEGIRNTQEDFTRNFISTIREVQTNPGTVGTLCGVRYSLLGKREDLSNLKVIGESEAYPEHVLAARPDLDDSLSRRISRIVIGMYDDPDGRLVLEPMASMRISHFTTYDPSVEKVTEELFRKAELDPGS